jgi:murein DD-endopeptidase MepM/ murein hydrolase activator NlpD
MLLSLLAAGLAFVFSAQAVTQADINKRRTELAALRESRRQAQGQINAMRGRRDEAIELKRLYDDQIRMVEEDIEQTMALIADINLAMAGQQTILDEAREREARLSEQFVERVKAMERMGELSSLSILLGADSLTDFLMYWAAVREIMARDKKLAEELIDARLEIEEAILIMDADRLEQLKNREDLTEAQAELAELSAEAAQMMAEYIAEMERFQAEERNLAEREAKAQREFDEAQREWARIQEEIRRRNNPFVGGEYHWPVPGHTHISSPFGSRIHPVFKVRRDHTGIDIPAPRGTPVVASNAGVIVFRGRNSGYGNYIVIDHGGNQATLYAHLHGFASGINVDTRVTRGQKIGYVGSTGVSTGNHLHFEIRINNAPVNPDPRLRGR